jgi:uncharacterized coiled-coil protein SlyX
MFGYKLIKTEKIENLKTQLGDAQKTIDTQAKRLVELENKVKEQDATIANLTAKTATVKSEHVEEKTDKPVKKVRRKSSKKTTKKEE